MPPTLKYAVAAMLLTLTGSCGARQPMSQSVSPPVSPSAHFGAEVRWEVDLSDDTHGWAPLWANGELVLVGASVSATSGEVDATTTAVRRVDLETGETQWERALLAAPAAAGLTTTPTTYLIQQGQALEAVEVSSGAYRWGVEFETGPRAVGAAGSLVAAMLPDGIVNVRSLGSGAQRWTLDLDGWDVRRFADANGALMGLATHADRPGELAVFNLSKPSSLPAWTAHTRTPVDGLEIDGALLMARFSEGLRVVALSDGEEIAELPDRLEGATLVAGLLILTESVEGLVLRMQRVTAFAPSAPEAPTWTRTVASASLIDSLVGVSGTETIVMYSDEVATALDGRTGAARWQITVPERDDGGRECTVLGTTAGSVVRRCQDMTWRVLSAIGVESD